MRGQRIYCIIEDCMYFTDCKTHKKENKEEEERLNKLSNMLKGMGLQ